MSCYNGSYSNNNSYRNRNSNNNNDLGPSILQRLSPGTVVDVVFDHTGPRGLLATFLGFEGNSALFLIDGEVLYITPRKIQAISLHAPRKQKFGY